MNNNVQSLKGILADGRVLDTAQPLPDDIARKLRRVQTAIRKDKKMKAFLDKRPPIAGGYNLKAFYQQNLNKVVKDLTIGSTGTLMLVTELVLKPERYKELKQLHLLYFKTYHDAQKALNTVLRMGVALVEYAGKETFELWGKPFQHNGALCAILVGFESRKNMERVMKHALACKKIPKRARAKLWKARRNTLPTLEKVAKRQGAMLPSGIDDVTFHPKDFARIMDAVTKYAARHKIRMASFGHIGVGSLHLRPFIDIKKRPKALDKMARDIFKIVRKYNGTLVGEHNAGFCRSRYLAMESPNMYNYMKKVKAVFDPQNRLNPKVLFNLDPITKHMDP